MGIAVICLWLSRDHFKKLVKGLFGKDSEAYDTGEPVRYENAILGLTAGGAFLFFFSWGVGVKLLGSSGLFCVVLCLCSVHNQASGRTGNAGA